MGNANDRFAGAVELTGPATGAIAIVPSDSVEISRATRGIYVGGAGNLSVVFVDDTAVTFSNVSAGTTLPLRVSRVKATGTTATNIIGLL